MRKLILASALIPATCLAPTVGGASTFFAPQPLSSSAYLAADDTTMTLNKDVAVALAPDGNSKTGATLDAGTKVTVIGGTNGAWTHIQSNGINGYVPTTALTK